MLPVTLADLLPFVPLIAGTLVAGITCHELSHALVLRASGVSCEIEVLPRADRRGLLRSCLRGSLASVTPTGGVRDLSPGRLRVAAMAPLAMTLPLALVVVGVLPDPFATGEPLLQAVVVGWMACALPSPQDFSLLWHPEEAIAEYAG